MLASTIQLPQQHPTNTSHQSTTLRPIPAGQTFTLEHHHNTQLRCPWLFQNPTVCQNPPVHDHAQHQPPHTSHPITGRPVSTTSNQPQPQTKTTHTTQRIMHMICLMFHPRPHTTNTHNGHQYQKYVKLCISMRYVNLLRKEVSQPHLPVRLPCYDLVPITGPTFDGSSPKGLGHRLRVLPTFVT